MTPAELRERFGPPEPHEVIVGRRGRWVWDGPAEPFGPRGHPERCDEWEVVDADWRLTFLCILQAIQMVAVVGGAYLFFRWARIACWLTGCG